MGLISALLWAAQVKSAQPEQVQTENGVEWHCPALVGKKVGLFLQKVLYTKGDGTDGYKFEVRHVFQPGSRRTYAEYSENEAATAIAALEKSMKDKDDRVQGNPQFSGGSRQQAGANPYAQNPNAVPHSRLQQAANQHAQNIQNPPDFDDDIPF